ncbi:YrvL family regulatory protein [Bacillus sp. FJAT-18017]|uniref:YrvL family regulatory protein n=1 Tax=Bacillus sp. FJAT-18017 TaxID=1705566 RepID=UPI0012E2B0CA|nr:YrvL family regulatory protein [Bacillus sp. FJAT-18017]
MGEDDKSFKEESFGTKVVIIIAIAVLIMGAVGFAFGVYYFGLLGIFNLVGVQYDSLFSFFLFVVLFFLLGIPGELVVKVFEVLLSFLSADNISTRFLINGLVNWSILSLADFFMDSIYISQPTLLGIACIIAIIETVLDKDEKRGSQVKKQQQ